MEIRPRYVVKCDECKCEIRRTDSVAESAAGGYCAACNAELGARYPDRVANRAKTAALREVARDYYALCDRAERLGVPVSLDDPRTPKTVGALREAVAVRER